MNKGAIQKFAIWARNELIAQVSQRAYQYGIDESGFGDASVDTLNGRLLTAEEKSQRQELIGKIKEKGYQQVMEEVAYTWFNRFIALRFMEVNNYLPSHIRVFSDASGAFKPEILNDVLHLDLPGLDSGKVAEYIESNDTEALYRYLLLTQCNALNGALPVMFERMGGYTEMLLPNNILRQDSVLGHMVSDIPEEDWQDAVQIIGWLYQYYNTELKDDTFAQLKKNVKITKERIPAATQLFTPDWIVRYMVENSLGRLWLEGHPNAELHDGWKYYLDEAEQEPEVEAQLAKLREEYKTIKPEEIKVIDPCMGSGHILVYAFDVLMDIYTACGWSERDAAKSILRNNLYGLDIDRRAYQLAYFAVMMKARQYNRRILSAENQPNLANFADVMHVNTSLLSGSLRKFAEQFQFADTYGSLMTVTKPAGLDEAVSAFLPTFGMQAEQLEMMMRVAQILTQKYDVVCTNPPYMGGSGMNATLSTYVKKNFPDSKSDLFACFMEKCGQLIKRNGLYAMITQHAWMFLSSYEKLREKLKMHSIVDMAHLGARAFDEIGGEVVQTTAFVSCGRRVADFKGTYVRLVDIIGEWEKEAAYRSGNHRYTAKQENFSKIPGSPVAYWVSENFVRAFENKKLYTYSISPSQNITGNNNKYVRKFWELKKEKIGDKDSWIFYAKGGGYRKWWGNLTDIVNWTPEARYIYQHGDGKHASQIINRNYWYKKGITWGLITSALPSFRIMPEGATFDKGGSTIIVNESIYDFTIGLLNSKVYLYVATILNPTLNFQVKDVCSMPILSNHKDKIDNLVKENIELSKKDWDSFETSWDFERHPLV